MFFQREHHRLKDEWGLICEFIKTLPYSEELIILRKR
jgi:hypothetical protein